MFFDRRGGMILLLVIYIIMGYYRVAIGQRFNVEPNLVLGVAVILSAGVIWFGRRIPKEVYVLYLQKP